MAGLKPARPLVAVALLLLGGCSGEADHREVVRFWAMGPEAEAMAQLLPAFEREHPQLRVEVQQMAWTAAHEKLLTAVAGDATPDVAQLGNSWIPELAALHALQPLTARQAASAALPRDDYFPGVWQTNLLGDTLYGVPWYVDTRLLYYRRDLLKRAGYDAPPRTWDEWLAQMRAIKKLVGPQNYAVLMPLNEFEPLQVLALQQPEPMLRDGARYGNFSSASFRKALGFYQRLFAERLAPTQTNTQISNVWNEMGRGYFSFYVSGPWNVGEFKHRLPPEQQAGWMTAPMPGPDGPGASSVGGASLVLFRRTQHADAAWQLIEYLSRPAVQAQFYAITGDLPPRRSSWREGAIASDPYIAAFGTQLERLAPFPQLPEWEEIMQGMRIMAERVAQGTQGVEPATAQFDTEVDAMLAKRRWLLERVAKRSAPATGPAGGT